MWDWLATFGTEKPWRPMFDKPTKSIWERAIAAVFCANGSSATASRARSLLGLIRKSRPHTKKLEQLAADPNVDLWAVDEVHFQQYGSRCRMWVPPEVKDPVVLHHPTRKSIGYFGAVRLRDGKFVFVREPHQFDAQTTWNFLKHLRQRTRRTGKRVVLIIDNARYHHAKLHRNWREEQAIDFQLDYLPAYSPELNPIERVWKLVRKLCLHDQYFATLQGVIEAVESQFESWQKGSETLRRLCAL